MAKTKTFGILVGDRGTFFRDASSLEELVPTYITRVIEREEGRDIGSGELKRVVQNYVTEYGETVVENQWNDYGHVEHPVITIGEVADHLMNQGWMIIGNRSVDNRRVAQMIEEWMKRNGILDYDGTDQISYEDQAHMAFYSQAL
jgi:hypothetical protein